MNTTLDRILILKSFYNMNGIMPTYEEMSKLYGWSSKNAAYKLAEKFIEEGYLKKIGSRLAPTDKFNQL